MTVEELIVELMKITNKTKYVDLEGTVWEYTNTDDPYDEGCPEEKSYSLYKVVEEKNYVSLRW